MSTPKNLVQLIAIAAFLASCTASQPLATHADDVYFVPSKAQATASRPSPTRPPDQEQQVPSEDDYYDAGTSQELNANRSYYDLAYNDPYYYNYGRFGFGMGWQNGWNGPGWGMGMGWGDPWMGAGAGWGWNNPNWINGAAGWGNPYGWNNPWGWNDPWAWNQPWGMGSMWNPNMNFGSPWQTGWGWNNGWGLYGNYWGPSWNCLGCITDRGRSRSTRVGHRPSMTRSAKSDPLGLPSTPRLLPPSAPLDSKRPVPERRPNNELTPAGGVKPSPAPRIQQPTERVRERRPIESPTRQPGFDRAPQGPTERSAPAPSRDGGGSVPARRR